MNLKKLKIKTNIDLPELVTADAMVELKSLFDEAISLEKAITLSAKNVQHIDTLGCQLIVSLQKTCAKHGIALDIKHPSDPFEQSLNMLGLDMGETL